MFLTKSNYMIGLQCPKYLWMSVHKKDELPPPDATAEHRFEQGHLLEEYAHKIYPKGILISSESFTDNLKKTSEWIEKRKTIFEAGIKADNLFSRADILKPVGKDEWDVIEIKSTSKVKPEHIIDMAFQKHVYLKAGLKIRKCFLMHVKTDYVRQGRIRPKKLLEKEDITNEVDKEIENVEANIKELFNILALKNPPEFQLKDITNSIYDNPIIDEFMESLPSGSVFELYRGGKKCIELFGQQICRLVDIPSDFKLTGHQDIQKKCAKTGKVYLDKEKIKEFISSLEYPLFFLDFETFSTVVPMFDDVSPYQQVPFQYSLHIVESLGAKPQHFEFLADGPEDQREKFLDSLKENLASKGSIIVYNQSFEKSVLTKLGLTFQEMDWVESILKRVVDLLIPFRNFHYYNPKQKGSASIKYVLPAITGKDAYKQLEINNGADASLQFLNITFGDAINKKEIRKNLLKYCELDTEGMVWVLEELGKV